MFRELDLHGVRGALVWGYRDVAGLRGWRIVKGPSWILTATLACANTWECRQAVRYRELLFVGDQGRWRFPIVDVSLGTTEVRATLGPPVQERKSWAIGSCVPARRC